MSTSTDTRPDDAFEADVRAMLARRAADVRPDDLSPELPTGLRFAVDHRAGAPGPSRARWVAVAAAALIVLAGLGLVVRGVGDGGDEDRSGPADSGPSTVTAPPRDPMFDRLPAGIDPTAGEPLFTAPPLHHDPAAAMAETLDPAFGEELSQPMPFEVGADDATEGRWWSQYVPLAPLDPDAWGAEDPQQAATGGWVLVRRDPGSPDPVWGVVAVDSAAIDLSDVHREGDHLAGAVRLTSAAPIRVVVSRPDGERLATSDLTTPDGFGSTPSVLALDEIEVGTGPVVLRVEAGDRPGQVGLDGVRVAALSEVVLPGTGGDGAPTPSETTTPAPTGPPTTEAPTGDAPDGDVPPVTARLWWPIRRTGHALEPLEMAALFVEQVLGEAAVEVIIELPEADTSAVVTAYMPSGAAIDIALARDDDGWAVTEVGGGGLEVDTTGGGVSFGGVTVDAPEERTRIAAIRAARGGWSVGTSTLPDLPDLDGATGVIVVTLDEQDRVVAAQGNPL